MSRGYVSISALLSCILQAGCAIYPTSRTFYDPNPADGTPHNRVSCGYMRTYDSLRRVIDGITIDVQPGSEKLPKDPTATLIVTIVIQAAPGTTVVDPSMVYLAIPNDDSVISGTLAGMRQIGSRPNWPYSTQWVTITFPEPAGYSKDISVILDSAVAMQGRKLAIAPFRFTRVTKSDVYYGSINC